MMNAGSTSLVALVRCEDYDPARVREALRRLLEPLGGMGALIRSGQRVLLKPNMIVPRPSEAAVTTHPEVVRAVALEVIAAGGRPFIGDSPAFSSARAVAARCGIGAVARELGLEIADLGRRPVRRRVSENGRFPHASFGAAALEADAIINLPKVKTHTQMGMSLGLKNLFGTVAGKRKAMFHFRNGADKVQFARFMAAITRYLNPAVTIEDAIVALERDGPTSGDPRRVGVLAASRDPAAADRVMLEVLGVDPATAPLIEGARLENYGCVEMRRIQLVGDSLDSLRVEGYVSVGEQTPIYFSLPRVARSVFRQAVFLWRARMEWH